VRPIPSILIAALALGTATCRRSPAPPAKPASPLSEIIGLSAGLQDVPFREIVEATTGHAVLPAGTDDPLLPLLARVLDLTLAEFNATGSPLTNLRRINEASRFFEDRLRVGLDAAADFSCDVPKTAEGASQRSGYPDLRIVHHASGRIYYLDPKLFETGSETSTLRTFYYEPKTTTGKVTEDAVHLLVGVEHDGNDGDWKFLRWHLVDLHDFRVRLKAEFQASNKDLYRPELLLLEGGSPENAPEP
jgi:hypothetical protein